MLRRSIISMADSTTDVFMRIFGPFLEQRWGQPIVLDLKPGGGAAIGLIAPTCAVAFSAVVCVWLFQCVEVVHTGPSDAGLPQLLGHSSDAAVRDSLGSLAGSRHGNETLVASNTPRPLFLQPEQEMPAPVSDEAMGLRSSPGDTEISPSAFTEYKKRNHYVVDRALEELLVTGRGGVEGAFALTRILTSRARDLGYLQWISGVLADSIAASGEQNAQENSLADVYLFVIDAARDADPGTALQLWEEAARQYPDRLDVAQTGASLMEEVGQRDAASNLLN